MLKFECPNCRFLADETELACGGEAHLNRVAGSLPDKKNPNAPSLNCAVIIKQVDEKTRSKTSINDLLRD